MDYTIKPQIHPVTGRSFTCMRQRTRAGDRERGTDSKFYLPGLPRPKAEPGRVERFVRRLLRQRGTYRFRITRKSQ